MIKTKCEKIKRVLTSGQIYRFKDGSEMWRRKDYFGYEYVLRAADGNTIDVQNSADKILEYLSDD